MPSLKTKLGIVIVAAVGVTILVVGIGVNLGFKLWACGLAAGALSLLMVNFLARGMTSPLREMADVAGGMARGEHGRQVTATSRDEVGELARAFNSMSADLAEVERMRKDLIANVSHELRTPISGLQAMLENLVDGVEPPDPGSLTTMLGQVERLGRLVEQLLDLSKLESGAVPLQATSFHVATLLEQAVREAGLKAQTEASDVRLSLDVVPNDLELHGDPERIHQVVANLLENALRHSPRGGTVRLAARARADRVVIEVVDQGPGIPIPDRTRVFERFYRTDGARSTSRGGTGLGLAIARWIVDMHGGEISVESAEPTGCRMVVALPGART
ncbi:MAG TPA: ATP-binding protein [Actinomycetota bacterium]|nr:ATP-binding protein [Actinomycetota bacterium]